MRSVGVPLIGLALAEIDVTQQNAFVCDGFWGIDSSNGILHGLRVNGAWEGHEGFKQGDVVGLLLDCDAGTLTVKKNGVRLGVAATGLTGELCWAASLFYPVDRVRIGAADAAAAGW